MNAYQVLPKEGSLADAPDVDLRSNNGTSIVDTRCLFIICYPTYSPTETSSYTPSVTPTTTPTTYTQTKPPYTHTPHYTYPTHHTPPTPPPQTYPTHHTYPTHYTRPTHPPYTYPTYHTRPTHPPYTYPTHHTPPTYHTHPTPPHTYPTHYTRPTHYTHPTNYTRPTPPYTHPTKPTPPPHTCTYPPPVHTHPTYPSITFSTNCDFCDHDLYTLTCIPNAFECASRCAKDRKCTHFTHIANLKGGTCRLKSAPGSGGAWASIIPSSSGYTCGYISKRSFSSFLLNICLGLDVGIQIP